MNSKEAKVTDGRFWNWQEYASRNKVRCISSMLCAKALQQESTKHKDFRDSWSGAGDEDKKEAAGIILWVGLCRLSRKHTVPSESSP